MQSPLNWTNTHATIAKGLDYVSPGADQAAKVVKVLRDNSMLNMEVFTDKMQSEMAAKIDRYMQLIATGYAGSSLESSMFILLTTWGVLKNDEAQEATAL